ncbi:DUF803-domain-containing protein [Trichodelitschia bisporula]|uniref:DUF803-domain-containing protein n=1 Tax=Trichodelitschia bisporula TaxID=703511 RepID=A0A6G1I286_9PEZI|nr:DUF803-domain-containing protein [Trichodelitschia bisporula]
MADQLMSGYQLLARNAAAASSSAEKPASYKVIGLILAIGSGLFIGVSFVLKKAGLLKANAKYNEEAGEGYGYLKNWWWWGGMTLMIIGEICNFAAYLFADAILVTPLGALSVVITAILSSIFLKERLSFVGKIGCFNCIVGAVVIAANAPQQSAVNTIQDMQHLVIAPGFLSYAGVTIVGCAFIALWAGPRYGKKSMLVYLTVCSLIGGLSVVGIQGLGAAITAQARGVPQFNQWFTYVLLVFIVATLLTEIIYLNKALNLYNAALVTPTYYVFFTSATIVSSAVLFRGFKGSPMQIITVVLGFLQICSGVVLLQLSKSAKDVPDAAVFSGDLDQVRTVAEQEEPEYEPRADTIRGGGSILRSISKARQEKQMREISRLHEEHMTPIGENEHVEFDGLRRRRTIIGGPETPRGSLVRRKTQHPPLGMSHFPDDDDGHNSDEDVHPGFLNFIRRNRGSRASSNAAPPSTAGGVPLSPLKSVSAVSSHKSDPEHYSHDHRDFAEDTAYRSHVQTPTTITWGGPIDDPPPRSDMLSPQPPPPPPHATKRQFSFQNVFSRARSPSASDSGARPVSRGGLSFVGRMGSSGRVGTSSADSPTEEERLGLVKGDSQHQLPSPPRYDSEEEWQLTSNDPSPGTAVPKAGPRDRRPSDDDKVLEAAQNRRNWK